MDAMDLQKLTPYLQNMVNRNIRATKIRRGKSFHQWKKEIVGHIVKLGYSPEFADAIAVCVSGCYTGPNSFLPPEVAAERGLHPQP